MGITLPPIDQIQYGVDDQCTLYQRVTDIITFVNELQICANENESNIGDVTALAPFTNLVEAIQQLLNNEHPAATSGDTIIDVDPNTQVITFDADGFVTFLEDPINTPLVERLETLLNMNKYIDDISMDPNNPGTYIYTYNDGTTDSFNAGISTDNFQTLTYGTDGLVYYNFGTLPVAP